MMAPFNMLNKTYRSSGAIRKLFIQKRSFFSGINSGSSSELLKAKWLRAIKMCENLRNDIVQSPNDELLIARLDLISNEICLVADACNFISSYHQCPNTASVAEKLYFDALSYVESLNTDNRLYSKIKELKSVPAWDSIDSESKHAANMFCAEFERSGSNLSATNRQLFLEANEAIAVTGSLFVESASTPTDIPISRCPTPLLALGKGNSFIRINESDLNSRYDDAREASWKLYHRFDSLREEKLCDMLNLRQKIAALSGFKNHCEREIKGSLAKSPIIVQDFLDELNYQLQGAVSKELDIFKTSKRTREPLGIWDISYYSSESRSKCLQNYAAFQNKLSLQSVIGAMNKFSNALFDVQLVSENIKADEIWHEDILKYSVLTENGKTLGIIYFDFYQRAGKSGHICLHTIQCGTKTQVPVVVIVCNFEKGSSIQMSDVNLLFHEYGHALHAVLGRTRYQHVSGTRCPTDFAEISSILFESIIDQSCIMEELFCFEKSSKLGLPNISFSKCFKSTETQLQLYYAMLDQLLHSQQCKDTQNVALLAQDKYLNQFDIPATTAWHHRFTHLYFYGGRYYSYLWAQSIVNIILEQHNLKDKICHSPKIRDLLEQGSSKDCSYQIESLLGESLTIDKMVDALVKPLNSFNTLIGGS